MKTPSNAVDHPISELIKVLQKLPPGTTFKYNEDSQQLYGCEVPDMDLGTSYMLAVLVVEGLDPPRLTDDELERAAIAEHGGG